MRHYHHKHLTWRIIVTSLLFSFFSTSWAEDNDESELPPVKLIAVNNLQTDARTVQQAHMPILLYFGSDYCSYCRYVEEEQLKPMLRNRAYDSKVLVRRVNVNSFNPIIHIDGRRINANELSSLYQTTMTPTLIFIDATGKEIAPRIIGVSSRDFYGGDLDNSIDIALSKLRGQLALKRLPP